MVGGDSGKSLRMRSWRRMGVGDAQFFGKLSFRWQKITNQCLHVKFGYELFGRHGLYSDKLYAPVSRCNKKLNESRIFLMVGFDSSSLIFGSCWLKFNLMVHVE